MLVPPIFPHFPNIDHQDFFVDPELPKLHFVFSSRYWSHTTKIPFMLLVDIGTIAKIIKWIFIDFRCPSFPTFPWKIEIRNSELCKNNL